MFPHRYLATSWNLVGGKYVVEIVITQIVRSWTQTETSSFPPGVFVAVLHACGAACDRFDFKYKVVELVKDKYVGGEVDEKYQVICRNCGSSGWGRRRRRDSYTSCCSDGRRRRHTKYATRRVCPEGRLTWGADKLRGQKQCSQGTCMSQDKATHFGQSNANQCDACTTTDKSANCNSAKSACLGSQMSPAVANPRSRQL